MTSIIGIRCGGFDQCMPTTREGSEQTSAIFVIGMPEVLEERMAPGAASCSSCGNSSCLSSSRSGIASATNSAPASAAARSLS